jgi:hypothetical protein
MREYLTLITWANHCSSPMRKNHFLLLAPEEGPGNLCAFLSHKQFHSVLLQIFIQKVHYRGILLLPLGILSKTPAPQKDGSMTPK